VDIVSDYGASRLLRDPSTLQDIQKYLEARSPYGSEAFLVDAGDDVALRNYLTEFKILNPDPEALIRCIASLTDFYSWLVEESLLQESPFTTHDFTRPVSQLNLVHQRPERFKGTFEEREISRLNALNHLAAITNRVPDVNTMITDTLDTLLELLTLKTAWVSLLANSDFFTSIPNPPPPHGFILGAVRNLPPSLEQSDCHFLRRPPLCQCQKLLIGGNRTRAFNVVECDRLRDAGSAGGDNHGLQFHASMPVYSGDQPVAILNFATEDWKLLTAADLQLLSTGAELLRSALQRARLYDLSEKQRAHILHELELARKVQANLMPAKLPAVAGYELAAFWLPAQEMAGDYYGVYKLPDRRWGLVVADVSGKGASSALFMAMTYSLIRERVEKDSSPASVLAEVNRHLHQQLADQSFVTAFYAVLDPARNRLTYANAGHHPPIVRRRSGQLEQLPNGSMALGVLPDTPYTEQSIHLEPGDSLVIYTDGVTDAFNPDDEVFDLPRLKTSVAQEPGSASALLGRLKGDLSTWVGSTPQFDDITVLVLTRQQKPARKADLPILKG
jgi:serine phosphatase RsbU (regulator of sigma subunit)